jgi:hypothetical protein
LKNCHECGLPWILGRPAHLQDCETGRHERERPMGVPYLPPVMPEHPNCRCVTEPILTDALMRGSYVHELVVRPLPPCPSCRQAAFYGMPVHTLGCELAGLDRDTLRALAEIAEGR